MQSFRRARQIVLFAALAGGALPLAAVLLTSKPALSAASASQAPAWPAGSAITPPRPAPAFALIGEDGQPTSLASFRGRWLVLAPAMTLCREVCPMTTAALIELSDALRRDGLSHRVAVAELTVDPWRDTPARLRAYRRLSGANFHLLTGTQAEIRAVWKFFGVYYQRVPQGDPPDIDWMTGRPETFDVEHTDAVFILDPAGRERIVEEGMAQVTGAMPKALRALLDAEGRRNLAHPQFPWTAGEVLADLTRLAGLRRGASGATYAPVATTSRVASGATSVETGQSLPHGGVQLHGSPATLAALRAQGGKLLGGFAGLRARLRALRGHPVVVNAWASWCPPCRAEMPIFNALARVTGGQVAFLGADTDDTRGAAAPLLAETRPPYPSYEVSLGALEQLAPVEGTPTTLFFTPDGRLAYVHPGEYESAAALEADVQRYALGR